MSESKPMSIKERIAMLNSNKAAAPEPVVPTGHVWNRPEAEVVVAASKPARVQKVFVKRISVPAATAVATCAQPSTVEAASVPVVETASPTVAPEATAAIAPMAEENVDDDLTQEDVDAAYDCFDRGDALFKENQFKEALEEYSKALAIFVRAADQFGYDIAPLHHNIGLIHHQLSNPTESLASYQRSLSLYEQQVPDSSDVAKCLTNMGLSYEAQSLHSEALEVYQRALRIRELIANEEEELSAACQNVALVLQALGRLEEALHHYSRALEIRRKAGLSDISVEVAVALQNMGVIHQQRTSDSSSLTTAQECFEQALSIREQLGPTDSADSTVALLLNLAGVCDALGDTEAALSHYLAALPLEEEKQRQQQQITTPHTPVQLATLYANISAVYHTQGDLSQALPYAEKALRLRESAALVLSTDSSFSLDLATSYHNVGSIHRMQERYSEALSHHNKSLAIREKLIPSSLDLALTLHDIGYILRAQNQYPAALESYKKSLLIREQHSASNGSVGRDEVESLVAATLNSMASVLLSLEKYTEAEDHCQRAIGIQERLLQSDGASGTVSVDTVEAALAKSLNTLGSVYKAKGRLEEGLSLYLRCLSIREKLSVTSSSVCTPEVVAISLSNVAAVYLSQGKLEQAREYVERSGKIKTKGKE